MSNNEILDRFETWLLASARLDGTIALRMRHARALARRVDLAAATADDLEVVMASRRSLAAETRKSELASWRVLFGWSLRKGIRADDPTLEIESIRVPTSVPKVAPDATIDGAVRTASPRDRALILLARYGCLRLSELTRLHMRDRDGDRLRVLGKGAKERIVYANEPLVFALRALERGQPSGYYFPGLDGAHMHPMSVNKIIKRVTGWNPHSLRHAGATAAYNATGDLRGVQEMLGHASLATTQRYLHRDDEARRRVAAGTVIQRPRLYAA